MRDVNYLGSAKFLGDLFSWVMLQATEEHCCSSAAQGPYCLILVTTDEAVPPCDDRTLMDTLPHGVA